MDELLHGSPADTTAPLRSPVMAWNEWDPLEEVIVGRLDGATIPSNHVTVTFNLPPVGATPISALVALAARASV